MSGKSRILVTLVAGVLLMAVGIGPGVRALPTREAQPSNVTIPYSGRLSLALQSDGAGQPVADGAYDLAFALYDGQIGGKLLWSEAQSGVMVEAGAFSATLGSVNKVPDEVLDGRERWLSVTVRGPGEATYTTLAPRQRLSVAPAVPSSRNAGAACPHDHWGEAWTGSVLGLSLNSTDSLAKATLSSNDQGVYGLGGNTGVMGEARGESSDTYGVFGLSTNGPGVYGTSTKGYGVQGQSSQHGVYGETSGDWGWRSGVFGRANGDHANGVTGWNNFAGAGVYAFSQEGSALYAKNVGVDLSLFDPAAVVVYSEFGDALYTEVADKFNWAGKFNSNVWVMGAVYEGSAATKIDHPLDPENQYLNHSYVASPDMKSVYDGVVMLDADGTAWVEMPAWFETLNKEFRYQLTPIGAPGPNLYIAEEVQDNRFQIAGGTPGLKVSWQVTGIRHDPYAEAHRIPVEEAKPAEDLGTYLHHVEYGQPATMGLDYRWTEGLTTGDER